MSVFDSHILKDCLIQLGEEKHRLQFDTHSYLNDGVLSVIESGNYSFIREGSMWHDKLNETSVEYNDMIGIIVDAYDRINEWPLYSIVWKFPRTIDVDTKFIVHTLKGAIDIQIGYCNDNYDVLILETNFLNGYQESDITDMTRYEGRMGGVDEIKATFKLIDHVFGG
jgi:hypothetical protein